MIKEKIEKIFDIEGGNSGLTEDFVYNNQPTNEEESIKILSGATIERNILGYVNKNSRPNNRNLKIFKAPFIQIVRKGLAGYMTYFNLGEFTANDDIYILTIKKEWLNKVNLRWFAYQYQELFYNLVTSKSDNATFNKEYAEKQRVKIPDIECQNNIAKKLLKIDTLIERLEKTKERIKELMEFKIT